MTKQIDLTIRFSSIVELQYSQLEERIISRNHSKRDIKAYNTLLSLKKGIRHE